MFRRLLGAWLVVLLSACGNGSSPVPCVDPPVAERNVASPLTLSLNPNPVAAGSIATLSAGAEGAESELFVGAGVKWQCWNGDEWIDTYQLVSDSFGDAGQPAALPVEPGATTTIPAIGLRLPVDRSILIPPVHPGTYRIADSANGIDGYVIVEVR